MASEIRVGKVSSIDYAAGMVRVVYHDKDDDVTRMIPLLSSEYHMPAVGDQVLVLHLSNGTEAGVILGRPWSEKNKPAEGSAGLYRKDLARTPGEAMIRYKDGKMTLKAGSVVVNGDLSVTGDLTVNGKLTVTGAVTALDVVGGGVSLAKHTHDCNCALSSGTTTGPV